MKLTLQRIWIIGTLLMITRRSISAIEIESVDHRLQVRHQAQEGALEGRIMVIEVLGGVGEQGFSEARAAGEAFEGLIEPRSVAIDLQPTAFNHALQAFSLLMVTDRESRGGKSDAVAGLFDEGIEVDRRMLRPVPEKAVVEQDIKDRPGIASTRCGDQRLGGAEGGMTIRMVIDQPMESDPGHDFGWGVLGKRSADEIGAGVAGEDFVIIGGEQGVGEEVQDSIPLFADKSLRAGRSPSSSSSGCYRLSLFEARKDASW